MHWWDINVGGTLRKMGHLHPFKRELQVSGYEITANFSFGHHCFTDEKENGPVFKFRGETRYFSEERYQLSFQLIEWIDERFVDGLAVPYFDKKNNRQYYCKDLYDYAIFFTVQKPQDRDNHLKIRIASAYEIQPWGRHGLPRGTPLNMTYILEKRNAGEKI